MASSIPPQVPPLLSVVVEVREHHLHGEGAAWLRHGVLPLHVPRVHLHLPLLADDLEHLEDAGDAPRDVQRGADAAQVETVPAMGGQLG